MMSSKICKHKNKINWFNNMTKDYVQHFGIIKLF